MGYKLNGVKTGGIPVEYIELFVIQYGIKYFVETGTAGGDSVRAVAHLFKECHSIEVIEGRPEGYFAENVTLWMGDSSKLLPEVTKDFKGERVLFWLDAHWSDNVESPDKTKECPLLDEIKAINGHDCLILIDDARLFLGPHPWPADYRFWPQFQDVFKALKDNFPKHKVTIIDDYIIAVPDYMDDTFRDEWWDRFKVRYPEDVDLAKSQLRFAYEYLKKFIE